MPDPAPPTQGGEARQGAEHSVSYGDWIGPGEAERYKPCDRIMVGSGGDTYDPICDLREGHDGQCKSTAAQDQHKLAVYPPGHPRAPVGARSSGVRRAPRSRAEAEAMEAALHEEFENRSSPMVWPKCKREAATHRRVVSDWQPIADPPTKYFPEGEVARKLEAITDFLAAHPSLDREALHEQMHNVEDARDAIERQAEDYLDIIRELMANVSRDASRAGIYWGRACNRAKAALAGTLATPLDRGELTDERELLERYRHAYDAAEEMIAHGDRPGPGDGDMADDEISRERDVWTAQYEVIDARLDAAREALTAANTPRDEAK